MFFTDLVQRKLADLLKPWLIQEPELELNLGFLRSQGTATNLIFDSSSLNRSLDESTRFSFQQVKVDQLTLRVSTFSSPALTLVVHGLHVTLSPREVKEERRTRKWKDNSLEDKKKVLSEIDPQGCALHDAMEKIVDTTASSGRTTSLLNVMLNHCQIKIHDIHLLVQSPISNESFSFYLEIKEINADSQFIQHRCIPRAVISSFCVPCRESSLRLDVRGFEIGLNSKNAISHIVPSTDLVILVGLSDLQLKNIIVRVPKLMFSFSPMDLYIIHASNALPSKKARSARNGRLLWEIASSRISSLISTTRLSLHKVVDSVCLWLRYIHAYEHLLLLVGYPVDNIIERSAMMMARETKFSRSVRHLWEVISEVEKKLPAEAIAQARRIIRGRVASHVQCTRDSCNKSLINSRFQFFWKILRLVVLIWSIVYSIFRSIICFFFPRSFLADHLNSNGHSGVVSEDCCPQFCFSLNVGEFLITISPANAVKPPVGRKPDSDIRISYRDLLLFRVSVDGIFFKYTKNICEWCFSLHSGSLKVVSSSVMEDSVNNSSGYLKGRSKKKVHDSETPLWGEPAQIIYSAESSGTSFANGTVGTSVPILERLMGEMWSDWKESCNQFEGSELQNLENPFLLCEIKSFLTNKSLQNLSSGFLKCSLAVGKLNFVLGYSSIVSLSVILRQIKHALFWTDISRGENVVVHTSVTLDDPLVIDRNIKYKSYYIGTKMAILGMLPENHIQIAAFLAGPHIRISLRNEGFHDGNADLNRKDTHDGFHLLFDMHNVELDVSPTSRSDFALLSEPQKIHMPISDDKFYCCEGRISLNANLKVNGLNVSLGQSSENQQHQIIVLNTTTIQFSFLRDDLRSFGATGVAISAALHWMATGITILLFLDELFVLVEAVAGLCSAVSHAFTTFDLVDVISCQELVRQKMVDVDIEGEGTMMGGTRGASSIFMSTSFLANNKFELNSIYIVIHNSRRKYNIEDYIKTVDEMSSKKLAMHDLPDYGICFSVQQSCMELSFKDWKVEVLIDFSGVRSVVFRFLSEMTKSSDEFLADQFELGNLLLHSLNCLYELSISRFTFSLGLGSLRDASSSGSVSNEVDAYSFGDEDSDIVEDSQPTVDTEMSRVQSFSFGPKLCFAPNILAPASTHWLLANISLSEVYLAGCPLKNVLVGAHTLKKFDASLSIGGEFQEISFKIQGGVIFLETTALAMFVYCFTSYYHHINNLFLAVPSFEEGLVAARGEDVVTMGNYPTRGARNILQEVKWEQLKMLTIDLSQLSFVLVAKDESGRLHELLFEPDVHFSFEVTNRRKKFSFGISKFSILSQVLRKTTEIQTEEVQIAHLSSLMSSDVSSPLIDGDPTVEFQHMDGRRSVYSASCSGTSVPEKESYADNLKAEILHISPQNYILKELSAFVAVEQPLPRDVIGPLHINQVWVGSGSISGFDMTISLPEIQTILFAIESLSGVFNKETTDNGEQRQLSSNQVSERSQEEIVPDGTIVAIQDVHQHMYIAVEDAESKYSLVGSIHYSLVGERALFKVKYHNPRRWKSQIQWFYLISLHAKSDSGESLQLNSRPGSGFVDISSCNDSGWALWRMLPYKPETYETDIQLDSYRLLAKNSFYLVNKKNDCAIAFVDGAFEFVSKPGNLFKWKVFLNPSLAHDNLLPDSSAEATGTNLLDPCANEERTSGQNGNLSCINVTIDKVTLTIVHELSDTREKFPLLQGSICTTDFVVQILCTKARIMSRLEVLLYYFDAQRNLWREFIHPVEICIFYRFRFNLQVSENVLIGVPVHFYAGVRELSISITELSLDILLFVIGKLNLAGPYAIKSSVILANCCKVENKSGLTLLCHFYGNQDVSIASRQSNTIFLRHLALVNQPPEASHFSIQLADQGSFSTSPIHLSLLEDQAFAWRTRIVSLQDSKAYPGPFVVIEISHGTEDGLSIAVSPLLRIQNETDFSMELRFQRSQQKESEFASVVLKAKDTIDDSMAAFGAINLSGGLKKALVSLSVGNFLYSFRPKNTGDLGNFKNSLVKWSDDLKGGKAIPLSGIFDKLSYQVRKAFSVESEKCSFSTAHCSLISETGEVAKLHFLIQSIRMKIPVIRPDTFGFAPGSRNSPVALQEQKEIVILPTVQVSNLLHSEIHVNLTDTDPLASICSDNIGKQGTIPCGSTVYFYANPATIYFVVTLTAFNSSCKPVSSGDWVKKLKKHNKDVQHFNIELNFGGGKYFASLRMSRGQRGILEVAIFTSYTLKNDTNSSLFCFAPSQKPLTRVEAEKLGSRIPPDLGYFLPPMSSSSWFMKDNKVRLKLLEENASETQLDLDALSGLTEIDLAVEEGSGLKNITKLGVALRSAISKPAVPTQIVSMNPRYVVMNESEEVIIVRQCYLEDEMEGMIAVSSKQKTALRLRSGIVKKKGTNIFDNFVRKHRNAELDSLLYIQFRPNEAALGWSGPICVASLGQFFLKFRRSLEFPLQQSSHVAEHDKTLWDFAAVNVVEEGSTLVLHFNRPPKINLPYRIENCLSDSSIAYYQKGSSEPEILRSGGSVGYVWDDLTLPHKLVIQIDDVHLLCEINLDKVRAWKRFYRISQHRGLGFHLPLDKKADDQKGASYGQLNGMAMVKLGYEVYADGLTRVLRICEFSDNRKGDTLSHSSAKMRLRISHFALHLLEHAKQEIGTDETSCTGIIVLRLQNINLDSLFNNEHKFNQIRIQSLSVDQKWIGAPSAAMIRRRQSNYRDTNDDVFHVVLILLPSSSNAKQIKYSSIILQPLDLNLDEETLMRIVPFWRTSLNDSNTSSQQYYFDHFEIHPIKIVASFLPGDSYSSYSSTQETLRTLLHSVIKIPSVKNKVVELNGVLVTHALITLRELSFKCARHYSWYAMRAIYIAKGSTLLPPTFASIFDDSASSSLDVFFDPSSGHINLPGLTLGTFKFISKSIDGRGFSGTKRYFGDLGKTLKTAGSNILFAAVTEISDSVLKGAEASGFNGMVSGFHHGILKLAMEPSVLGKAFMEGGPDRKIKLDQSPGIDELYVEGYLQAMLDAMYKQEYLRVRVIDNQVVLKNLPPNSALIDEIMERVKGVLVSRALLKGDPLRTAHPLRHLRGESEWKIGPIVLTLCEHLFVSFAIRVLRKQAGKVIAGVKWKDQLQTDNREAIVPSSTSGAEPKVKFKWKWGISKFLFSGVVAYIDGRLCRCIPNPIARRIVSGFLLSFLDNNKDE